MRLILLRHGQSPSNVLHVLDTVVPGPPLTTVGQEQAQRVTDRLADEPVDAVYASTQMRAQMTAAPFAAANGLTVEIRDGLREISAGDLETRGDAEATDTYISTCLGWARGDREKRMPGGESGTEALSRFERVVDEVLAHRRALIVSHGGVLRLWTGANTSDLSPEFIGANPLSNTGMVVVEGDRTAGWRVLSWDGRPVSELTSGVRSDAND